MWKPVEHNEDENLLWAQLRAMEWRSWPVFLSQAFVPAFFIFYDVKIILCILVIANLIWGFMARRFVNLWFAYVGVYLVKLSWPVALFSSGYLLMDGRIGTAALAILYVPFCGILGSLTFVSVGKVQGNFIRAIGYTADQEAQRREAINCLMQICNEKKHENP